MQKEILGQYGGAPLSVYVVWFSMVPTDGRAQWGWTGGVISDNRAIHYWDEKKIVGTLLGKEDNPMGESPGVAWGAFYLYGADAEWNQAPPPIIVRGATVHGEAEILKEKIEPILKLK